MSRPPPSPLVVLPLIVLPVTFREFEAWTPPAELMDELPLIVDPVMVALWARMPPPEVALELPLTVLFVSVDGETREPASGRPGQVAANRAGGGRDDAEADVHSAAIGLSDVAVHRGAGEGDAAVRAAAHGAALVAAIVAQRAIHNRDRSRVREDRAAAAVGLAVAQGQSHEAGVDRADHVEEAILLLAVDHCQARTRAADDDVLRDVEVAGGVGVLARAVESYPENAGRQDDGVRARGGVGRVDGLAKGALAVAGSQVVLKGGDVEDGRDRTVLEGFETRLEDWSGASHAKASCETGRSGCARATVYSTGVGKQRDS